MSVAAGRELGLKVQLTRAALGALRAHPSLPDLALGAPVSRTRRAIYFDTPDHRLHAHGLCLRLSSEGEGWMQTVVRAKPSGEPAVRDGEVVLERPEPDMAAIVGRGMRRRVAKAVARRALQPVFETVVERTTRRLRAGEGELELALDEGVMRAGKAEDALIGAELGLRSGSPLTLIETAARLFGAEHVPVTAVSDAERGYRLARLRAASGVRPERGVLPKLAGTQSCGAALTAIIAATGAQILANRRAVLEIDDPAAAHQLRIGLRRLRSALRAFRRLHESPALGQLERHARALARSVGELRDADVLIEGIYAPAAGALAAGAAEGGLAQGIANGMVSVREALFAHRAAARSRARTALTGRQWSLLQLHLALAPRTVDGEARLCGTVEGFARSALKRQWKKVSARGVRLDELTLEERHALRKALKELRYLCEFFACLYPRRRAQPFIAGLRALQEVLGYLNDVAGAERIAGLTRQNRETGADGERAAASILGWHAAEAAHAWRNVHKLWRRLRQLPHFWT
jgi:triphosphatase